MLSPNQVLPFLTHEVHYVRAHAAGYLMDVGEAAPAATAIEAWRGIDLYGKHEGEDKEYTDSVLYLDTLIALPQNEESIQRSITATQKWKEKGDDEYYSAQTLLAKMPLHLIDSHIDDVLELLDPEGRKILNHRLRLRTISPQELWDQLLRAGQTLQIVYDDDLWSDENRRFVQIQSDARRIIDALAEHRDFCLPKVLAELQNLDDAAWLQSLCLELMGQLRYPPALEIFVAGLISDNDMLNVPAENALQQLDPLLVVPRLEEAFKDDDPSVRIRIAELLGKIKNPEAEAALLRIYSIESGSDPEVLGFIANALTDLCSAEAIGILRQGVLKDLYISSLHDIKSSLLATMVMVGRDPGEIRSFDDDVRQKEERQRAENLENDRLLQAKYAQEIESRKASVQDELPPPPPEIIKPIRRDAAKIGRNDQCPCGSGKKYKKCCGK